MTLKEILELPDDDLTRLTDQQLITLLAPHLPACREPDRPAAQLRDVQNVLAAARKMVGLPPV